MGGQSYERDPRSLRYEWRLQEWGQEKEQYNKNRAAADHCSCPVCMALPLLHHHDGRTE